MKTYQDKSSQLYQGLPFMKIRGEAVTFPCVAEIKFDGEFQYLISQGKKVYLVNKEEHGRIRTDMPVTNIDIPDNSVFLAELIYGKGNLNFYDFLRHKLSEDLNLAVFGCLRIEGQDIWKDYTYAQARQVLEQQKFYNGKVVLVPRFVAYNQTQLDDYYNRVIAQGFEGIVIKDPLSKYIDGETGRWVKRKFETENDLVICGFESGSKRAKTLSVLVGHRLDGKIVPITHVGGGFKAEQKDALLKVLQANVTHREGAEYMVNPTIVVKVKHYGAIRDENGIIHSLRHPQFQGFRPDKAIEEVDTLK